MKIVYNLLFKISYFLNVTAIIINRIAQYLENIKFREKYYVYVPNANKPRVVHSSYMSAQSEADRLAGKLTEIDKIEILQVVKTQYGENIPF